MCEHIWPFVSVVSSPSRIRALARAGISFFSSACVHLVSGALGKVIPGIPDGLTVVRHVQPRIKPTHDDGRRREAVRPSQVRVQFCNRGFATFARLAEGNRRSNGSGAAKDYRDHRTGIAQRAPSRHRRRPRLRSRAACPSRSIVKRRTRSARQAYSALSSTRSAEILSDVGLSFATRAEAHFLR